MTFTRPSKALVLTLFCFFASTLAQNTCGSLVTYRQYSSLLQDAPTCFLQGCGSVNSTSMSAGCPSQAPCFDLWDSLQKQWQGKNWCQTCGSDTACRISGWPVLNASATCNTNPGKWLFGAQGDCCASGDEASQLAHWVGTMCNGSEWREKFSFYGGMAEEDWAEYILPWNQTVSPLDVDPHAKRQPPGCSKTPFYLGVFFIENLLYLAAALLFGWYRLWLIKRKERKFASDPTQRGISRLLWWHRSQVKTQDAVKPSFWTRSFLGGFLPIMVGILLAAAQVGLNMASAYIIQQTPGYGHVDIAHLGLLFCSRPRLTWVVCVLALWRKRIPRHFFKLKFSRTAAKATLASVAVSSTISEGILQIVGVYYMGITANSGREKGFYAPHHLRPYYRGVNAWTMYVGALMWLIACVPIIIIWPVLSMYHSRIFFLLHRTRMRFWSLLRLPGYREDPYDPAANISTNDFNEENTFLFLPNRNDWNLLNRDPAAFPALIDENGFNEPDLDDYNGFNEGIGPADANDPTQMQETGALLSPFNMRGGDASSIHPSMMQESGDNDYGISSHASPSASGVVLRRGGGNSGLRGGDGGDEELEMYSIGLRGGAGDENDGGRYYSDTYAYPPPRNRTLPSRGPRYTQVRQTSGQGVERQTSLRGGAAAAAWKNKHLLEPTTKFDWYHLQAPIIWLGVVIGLISYAAQWMFWDGFVKASGERFCHPKLLGTAVTWAVGSVLTGILPFGLQ